MSEKKIDDGGPAFPNDFEIGLTKLEWFAGMALMASAREVRHYEHENNYRLIAEGAFKQAKAMIEESKKYE